MYIGWKRLVLVTAVLAVGGFLFAWSGIFNVAASTGHWAITEWFLHWAMRNSVRTHALGINPPRLDEPALVHRGAGHYASGCAPCHGAPGRPQSPVALEMTPMPPRLSRQIHKWNSSQLFWIVKHGVKYTGMPAWVARHRDDEVWAMVAFIERLPEMTPRQYLRLSTGAETPRRRQRVAFQSGSLAKALDNCARCHGRDGAGRGVAAFPILSGQSRQYLYNSLQAYAAGERHSGIMQPAVSGIGPRMLRVLAEHYAEANARRESRPTRLALLREGKRIATRGQPADLVPACIACHGPRTGPRRPAYPQLAGQYPNYLAQQLRLFQQGARGGTRFSPIMHMIAGRLSERQILAVTAYYASLRRDAGNARLR
jgi:cytochrome c553